MSYCLFAPTWYLECLSHVFWGCSRSPTYHYCDAIMGTIASQITSLTMVYTTVYSDADQSKHQSSASLAFVRGIHRDRWIPRTKGQLRGKCFHLMTSSCYRIFSIFWGRVYASKYSAQVGHETRKTLEQLDVVCLARWCQSTKTKCDRFCTLGVLLV